MDEGKPPPDKFLDGVRTLDMRPRFPVPYPDDELTPVMGLLDEFMLTRESEPPMRSLDGWPVEVRAHAPIGMHELAAAGVNDEEMNGYTRLPPPKILTLARHTPSSMALMVERYIAFFKLVVPKNRLLQAGRPKEERRRSGRGPKAPAGDLRHPLSPLPRFPPAARLGVGDHAAHSTQRTDFGD